ncbi:MAG TPA: hypothetical protein VGL76_05595 [Gaiellaceae bacterium]
MLRRTTRPVLAVAAALAIGLGAGVDRASAAGSLFVTFNLNHTISVTMPNGSPVGTTSGAPTQIPSGDYSLDFDDSVGVSGPSFTLTGPGVNISESLTLGEYPSGTLAAVFQPNATYTWWDAENSNIVFTFQTTSQSVGGATGSQGSGGGTTSSGSGSSSSKDIVGSGLVAFRGSLDAIVYASGRLSLSHNGNVVKKLKTGRWTFSVDDESKKAGFQIQLLHGKIQTVTSKTYVGSHDVTVNLKPGRWTFFTAGGKKTTFFVTS